MFRIFKVFKIFKMPGILSSYLNNPQHRKHFKNLRTGRIGDLLKGGETLISDSKVQSRFSFLFLHFSLFLAIDSRPVSEYILFRAYKARLSIFIP